MADPQFSVPVRNQMLDAIEAAIGTNPILRIRSGAPPANTAAARTGNILATINLPTDWMLAASAGGKQKSGTWEDVSADATGVAGHFEIMDSTGAVCGMQADVSIPAGTGFMKVSTVNFEAGVSVLIDTFSLTAPGA